MFGTVFSRHATATDLQDAASAWEVARRYTVAAGILCTVVGAVIVLKNVTETNTQFSDRVLLGGGGFISLLGVFYGFFLGYFICLPLQKRLESRAVAAAS